MNLDKRLEELSQVTPVTPFLRAFIAELCATAYYEGKAKGRSEGWNDSLVWSGQIDLITDPEYLAYLADLREGRG